MNQLALEAAEARRDEGIARSAKSAGKLWHERALGFVCEFAARRQTWERFMCEDIREWAESSGLDVPPTRKAWGAVMQDAKRKRIVNSYGFAPARSSNLSGKVQWGTA